MLYPIYGIRTLNKNCGNLIFVNFQKLWPLAITICYDILPQNSVVFFGNNFCEISFLASICTILPNDDMVPLHLLVVITSHNNNNYTVMQTSSFMNNNSNIIEYTKLTILSNLILSMGFTFE